jgi:hypothetical protein
MDDVKKTNKKDSIGGAFKDRSYDYLFVNKSVV